MLTGTCLCGACQVTIEHQPAAQLACHCTDCQKVSGGAFTANLLVPPEEVQIRGEVKEYTTNALSGGSITRFFCPLCGSLLGAKSTSMPKMDFQTGLFPECTSLPFYLEIFVKDRFDKLVDIPGARIAQITPSVDAQTMSTRD
ncbi:hypothetical protein P7C73_g1190, partial [Tremellales sp. Uapishka_1]